MAKLYEISQEIIHLLVQSYMKVGEIYSELDAAFIDSPELRSKLKEPIPGYAINN